MILDCREQRIISGPVQLQNPPWQYNRPESAICIQYNSKAIVDFQQEEEEIIIIGKI